MLEDSCEIVLTSRVVNVDEVGDSLSPSEVVLLSILSEVNNALGGLRIDEIVISSLQELQASVITYEDVYVVVLVSIEAAYVISLSGTDTVGNVTTLLVVRTIAAVEVLSVETETDDDIEFNDSDNKIVPVTFFWRVGGTSILEKEFSEDEAE